MIYHFYAHLPIRKKFDWIVGLLMTIVAIPLGFRMT